MLPWLAPTSGAYQTQMAVCGQQGAGWHSSTAGSCSHYGWLAPSSGCWQGPVGPKGRSQDALHLLSAASGVHQAQMAVCGHQGAGGHSSAAGYCGHHMWLAPSSGCLGGSIWTQRVRPCSANTLKPHQWCAPVPSGSVWPPGGTRADRGPCLHRPHGCQDQSARCLLPPLPPN